MRERVISLHPWLAERVPWSYRHFERYDRALREFDLDEVALRRWAERVNAQVERWFDQRETRAIPWTTSVFLCRALRDDCRRRRIGVVPPRAGKTPQGRFLPRL